MRRAILSMTAVVLFGVASVAAVAQSPQAGGQDHSHELSDFAAASLDQCQLAIASVEDIARFVDDASRAADVTRSRTALDAAARSVREVRQHLGSCADILKLLPQTPWRRTLRFTTTTATILDVLCRTKMDLTAIPTASHEGQPYYFCSEADRDEFQKEPARFLAEPHR